MKKNLKGQTPGFAMTLFCKKKKKNSVDLPWIHTMFVTKGIYNFKLLYCVYFIEAFRHILTLTNIVGQVLRFWYKFFSQDFNNAACHQYSLFKCFLTKWHIFGDFILSTSNILLSSKINGTSDIKTTPRKRSFFITFAILENFIILFSLFVYLFIVAFITYMF